ncbi:hypothetical protein DAPPUDRAFT_118341 [Daphnia pulex]|uniref:Uncharacterized protein n=1 Tax=Daphnia pulex TaxID=6669 RepID=E9HVH1_DAPPU|nr:hypothetical protein DAPPUDRAFT_118341 [Daphnia pulex]|eukprot:EFX64265.1 hypothetical protein DAPPUDRAFT_118341 [Daphnia pulex]
MSSYGARPKTKSIFRKNLEDLNDISTDKTVPILPTKLPLSVPITSTPLASTVQKRQTIDTRLINRPTRSNKNYVQLKIIKSPGTVQSNHTSVGQISIIKKSSGTTDTIIEIPEDLTVNEISNFPVKNTENKTIFIQNNAEISVTNHNLITTANGIDCQSAVEEEDTLFEILDRIGGLIRNLPPTVLPTPVAFNNSTIEAIHNPITYTPYIHFDNVISELGKHSIAVGGEEESVEDIIEFPVKQTISHGNEDGRNTINSQQIRVFGDERTEKAPPKLLDELRDNKVNYGYLEEGASSNRYFPTSGISQNNYQESVRPIFPFPSSSSGFPNPPEIHPFTTLDPRVRNDSLFSEPFSCICEFCSDRANNDNRIHQRDLGIPTGSENIQYQIRNDQSCLGPESAGNFLSVSPTQTAIVDIELSTPRSEKKVNFAVQSDNQHNKSERLPYFPVVSGSEFIAPFQPSYPRSGVHSSDIDTPNYLSGACATNEVNQKSPNEDTVSEKVFNFCSNIGRFDSFAARTESRIPNTDRDFVERNCNAEQTNRPKEPSKTSIKDTSYGGKERIDKGKYNKEKMATDSTRPKPSFFEQHRTVDEPPRRARKEEEYERRSDERNPSGWAGRGSNDYRPRESDTQSSDTDESTFFVEYQPSRDTIKNLKPKGNNNSSSMRSPSPKKASSPNRPSQNFSDTYKGRGAMTMLNQIQNYTGSPAVRFDRWIKYNQYAID